MSVPVEYDAGEPVRLPSVLSVMQPWAGAIFGPQGKDVENRRWPTQHRGALLIHVPLSVDYAAPAELIEAYSSRPNRRMVPDHRGQIIGVVDLVGVHLGDVLDPSCSPWAEFGAWHWQLARPRLLAEPVPHRGALSLWRPRVPFGAGNLPACDVCGRPYPARSCSPGHALIAANPRLYQW